MISAHELKAAVDPVQVISGFVRLRKVGKRHAGLCPFHDEKTPSFSINELGLWHCFGCGKGGDIYSFLELVEGLSFRGALRRLAGIAGVPFDSHDAYEAPSLAMKLSDAEVRSFDRWLNLKTVRLSADWDFLDDQLSANLAFLEEFFNSDDIDRTKVDAVHAAITAAHEGQALIDEQLERLHADPSFMIEPFLRGLYGDRDFRAEVQGL